MKERILDIGIGSGGDYLWDRPETEERFGIDINRSELKRLKESHPEIEAVQATAEHLPFQDNSFHHLVIMLPSTQLLRGLQTSQTIITHPHGWYPEFQRVLVPNGEITIYGDRLVKPNAVEEAANGFFTITSNRRLSPEEFAAIGTQTSTYILETYSEDLTGEYRQEQMEKLVKIQMTSKKEQ